MTFLRSSVIVTEEMTADLPGKLFARLGVHGWEGLGNAAESEQLYWYSISTRAICDSFR